MNYITMSLNYITMITFRNNETPIYTLKRKVSTCSSQA